MEYKSFKNYLEQRQLREAEEAMKVDPVSKASQRKAGVAVAKTLQHTNVDVAKTQTDPRMKNKLLGKALARAAQDPVAGDVSVRDVADTISPDMKV